MANFVETDLSGLIIGLYTDEPGYAPVPAGAQPVTEAEAELLRGGFGGYALVAGAVVVAPIPQSQIDAVNAASKAAALTEARALRAEILARLNGIHLDAIYNNDVPPVIAAIMVAKQQLKDITILPAVLAAVDGAQTKVVVLARYYEIAAELGVSAPSAVTAFVGLDT